MLHLDTKVNKSVRELCLDGFRCRRFWRFSIACFLGRANQIGFGWVKFQPTDKLMNALNKINNVSTTNLLFEDVEGDYY